jgi:hypothetical protein
MYNAFRYAPEILHEHHPQGDRNRPEFADRQWLYALIRADETMKHFRIEPAVGVRNKRPSQAIDAGIALQVTLGQLRQFSIVAGWQVIVDLAQLFIDDVIIVDQPLCRRRNRALLMDRPGDGTVGCEQDPSIFEYPGQQRTAFPWRRRDTLGGGKTLAVLLKTLGAEELGPDWFRERRTGYRL